MADLKELQSVTQGLVGGSSQVVSPQGSMLSPLLFDLLLIDLDKETDAPSAGH